MLDPAFHPGHRWYKAKSPVQLSREHHHTMSVLGLFTQSSWFARATASWLSILATSIAGLVLLLAGAYIYVGPWSVYTCGFRNLKSEWLRSLQES